MFFCICNIALSLSKAKIPQKMIRTFSDSPQRKMGCLLAKGVNSPTRGLKKLKLEYGYAKGRDRGQFDGSKKQPGKDPNKSLARERYTKSSSGSGGENKMNREGEKGSIAGGNVPRRVSVKTTVEEDDMVGNGWPKWLVDHIPRDALAGLALKTADSYDKIAKVGRGTYSNVYKARDRETQKIVALKKVRFDTSEPESVKFMAREIILLRKLDHPNIIKLEGLATSRMQYSLYLVFDYMQSDLTRVITGPGGRLTEPQVKSYMHQLLSGLQHCHEEGILHRDIKGSNLLIDRNGMLKLADFGLANYYRPRSKRPLTSRVVTLWYRAPELLLGSTEYEVGIDLWSAGCLLAEMFLGRPIMPGRNEIEQLHKIFKLCGSPPDDYWKKLKATTTFRPPHCKSSFQEVFQNLPDSAIGLLKQLLSLDPAYRGTAASALQNEFFTSSPLACDLKDLPVSSNEDDDHLVNFNDQKREKALKAKRRSRKGRGLGSSDIASDSGDNPESSKEEKHAQDSSMQSQETTNSTTTTITTTTTTTTTSSASSSLKRPSKYRESSPPPSPTPAVHHRQSQQDRSAITEAHPNALKNIKNYPLLLASIREVTSHLQESRLSINRKAKSTIDLRNLDADRIAKLLGYPEN